MWGLGAIRRLGSDVENGSASWMKGQDGHDAKGPHTVLGRRRKNGDFWYEGKEV